MSDKLKFGKPVVRDMKHLRIKPPVKELVEHGVGYLTDLSGNHSVRLDWRLNEEAKKDQVFKLTVDDKEVYLELDELLYYTRIFFMK